MIGEAEACDNTGWWSPISEIQPPTKDNRTAVRTTLRHLPTQHERYTTKVATPSAHYSKGKRPRWMFSRRASSTCTQAARRASTADSRQPTCHIDNTTCHFPHSQYNIARTAVRHTRLTGWTSSACLCADWARYDTPASRTCCYPLYSQPAGCCHHPPPAAYCWAATRCRPCRWSR